MNTADFPKQPDYSIATQTICCISAYKTQPQAVKKTRNTRYNCHSSGFADILYNCDIVTLLRRLMMHHKHLREAQW